MTFSIFWQSQARKFLRKLPSEVSKRIVKKIKEIKENPFRYLEHFEGNGYKFRIGDYRLIIDVDQNNKILKIRVLDKRSRIYKR
jgi:mRNA interferase RelE/StbE